ncbi:MAG TPA: alpha/beta fold hydrolase [Xanthobacteraceae bacterium]|nr:alpha/beta fold hydrolase [Xanthobacteraceae bacterium]
MLKWLLVTALVGYGAIAALAYFAQRSLMYFPDRTRTAPAAAGFPQADEIVLTTSDGERVIVWHVAPRGDQPVVLYFHGNGGALDLRAERFARIVADGTGLVALSYRGYGGSTGRPSEAGLLRDAQAVYAFAAARYPAERLVLFGESLGSGVAVALAAEHKVGKVILEAPFTSAVDIGAAAYPFLPVRLLMHDRFRSDQRIGKVTAPVLVLHGARDTVVPIRYGERLYALIGAPKKFVRFPEGHHSDLDTYGAQAAVRDFLATPAQ